MRNDRRNDRPTREPRTDPYSFTVPNVVGAEGVSESKMLVALKPYRDFVKVRAEMDELDARRIR